MFRTRRKLNFRILFKVYQASHCIRINVKVIRFGKHYLGQQRNLNSDVETGVRSFVWLMKRNGIC